MNRIIANWKKTTVFCAIFAVVSAVLLTLFSMEPRQIVQIVLVSTAIMAVLVNYTGIFPHKE